MPPPHLPAHVLTSLHLLQFVGILAVNAPVLGPWIAKSTSGVRSKNRSKSGPSDQGDCHLVTIGQQSNRLERLTKESRALLGVGWTTIDNDSEERMVQQNISGGGSAKSIDDELGQGAIHVMSTFDMEVSRKSC